MVLKKIACRCGAERIRGDSCGDCGYLPKSGDPAEVNPDVVRRQRLVGKVEELRARDLRREGQAVDFWDIVLPIADGHFGDLLDPLLGAEATTQDAEPIAAWLVQLDRARSALMPTSNLRPHAETRAQLEVLDRIASWWPIYRTIATTVDRTLIEKKKQEGQVAVDTAMQAISKARPTLDALAVLDDYAAEPSLTKRQIQALRIKHEGMSLQQLESIGAEGVTRDFGVPCPTGMGLHASMVAILAEGAFLPASFSTKVTEAVSLWGGEPNRILAISQMTGSVERLADVSLEFSEAFVQFDQAIKVAPSVGAVVRSAKRLLALVYEESQPLWAWSRLLLEQDRRSGGAYLEFAESNSTTNVEKLKQALPTICADAESFYRNATHHGGAVIADEACNEVVVTTRRDGERRMSTAAFIDRLYALVESVLALHWVSQVYLAAYEIKVPVRNDMPSGFGVSVEDEAFLHFEAQRGIAVYRNEIVSGTWFIEAEVPNHEIFGSAVLLALRSGGRANEVCVSQPGRWESVTRVATEHVEDRLRSAGENSEEELVFRLLCYRAASFVNGQPILTDDDVRFGASVFAFQLLAGEVPDIDSLRRLRRVLGWARERTLEDASFNCSAAMKVWREQDEVKKVTEMLRLGKLQGSLRIPEIPVPTGVIIEVPKDLDDESVPFGGIPTLTRVADLDLNKE